MMTTSVEISTGAPEDDDDDDDDDEEAWNSRNSYGCEVDPDVQAWGNAGKPVRAGKLVLLRMWANLPRVVMLLKRARRDHKGELDHP